MEPSNPLDRVVVVLVETQHPGNVGASARAMKNMGLRRLVLVNPAAYDPEQARWMAPGCDDVLADMRIVSTLEEALVGVDLAVASTARHRKRGLPVIDPPTLATGIFDRDDGVTAILFGREDFGLSDADVLKCASILRIPTPEHASLNLAQAVLLVSWSLFDGWRARGGAATGRMLGGTPNAEVSTARAQRRDKRDRPADVPTMEPAIDGIVGLLDRVGYLRGVDPSKVGSTFRGLLQRARASIREVEAFRGMLNRIDWALDHPDVDWKRGRSPG
jgi:tRNA (cytidine32/uridine32-2'-O)-methyltransferase